MSFLQKFLPKRFRSGPVTPDIISKIADDVKKKIDAESPRPFVEAYRNFRQYRADAGIRRQLAKTRAYAISSRPRLPQHSAKIGEVTKHQILLTNGQVINRDGLLWNPVLERVRLSLLRTELKAA